MRQNFSGNFSSALPPPTPPPPPPKKKKNSRVRPCKELSVELFTDPSKLVLEKCKHPSSITSIKNKMASVDNPKLNLRFVLQMKL